jgi:hypothetical protein
MAKKLLTTIPVRRPHKQDFIRVNPGLSFRELVALVDYERDTYVVTKRFAPQLGEKEYYLANLFVCHNRQKVLSLWPVKQAGSDGKLMEWHRSAQEAAELAMTRWIRVTANMDLGAYEMSEAIAEYDDPVWPEVPFRELLRIAFKGRIIDSADHIVVQKLRGLA